MSEKIKQVLESLSNSTGHNARNTTCFLGARVQEQFPSVVETLFRVCWTMHVSWIILNSEALTNPNSKGCNSCWSYIYETAKSIPTQPTRICTALISVMAQDPPSPESNLNQQPYTPTTVSRTNSAALFSKCWQSPQTGKSVKKNMVSETHPVPG